MESKNKTKETESSRWHKAFQITAGSCHLNVYILKLSVRLLSSTRVLCSSSSRSLWLFKNSPKHSIWTADFKKLCWRPSWSSCRILQGQMRQTKKNMRCIGMFAWPLIHWLVQMLTLATPSSFDHTYIILSTSCVGSCIEEKEEEYTQKDIAQNKHLREAKELSIRSRFPIRVRWEIIRGIKWSNFTWLIRYQLFSDPYIPLKNI